MNHVIAITAALAATALIVLACYALAELIGWRIWSSLAKKGQKEDTTPTDMAVSPAPKQPLPEILDDWEPKVGDWFEREACPCGCYAPDWHRSTRTPYPTVCPKCGHRLELRVIRYEWEHSESRFKAPRRSTWATKSMRNARIVFWTPEHCKKGAV